MTIAIERVLGGDKRIGNAASMRAGVEMEIVILIFLVIERVDEKRVASLSVDEVVSIRAR